MVFMRAFLLTNYLQLNMKQYHADVFQLKEFKISER